MPVSIADVATSHGSRYLQQLCKHWAHKFAVTFTPEAGTITFNDSRTCHLVADATLLRVTAECPPEGDLARLQAVIEDHIRRFAFREELAFAWRPADSRPA